MKSKYALVDVNNMYVAAERAFSPRLMGRPVVVLSSNDGACIARSNEAKDLGVAMAQPWFQVKHFEKSHGLVALSANFELYADMSSRMMMIAGRYAPGQEIYSIDECFLDFDGVPGDLVAQCRDLRATVLRETGLPTSVGLASTKTLAKLANHVGKTADRKPGSYPAQLAQVCDFGTLSTQQFEWILSKTEVGAVWGIGRKVGAKLIEGGIKNVLDLARADTKTLRRNFNVVVEKTVLELQGTECFGIEDAPEAKQQILVSRSFGTSITEVNGIVEAVSEFASRAAEKLRQQDSAAGAINVFFMTSPFRANDPQHSVNVVIPLPKPTSDSRFFVDAAVRAARSTFRSGFRYAKAGVMLMELQSSATVTKQGELDLFGPEEDPMPAPKERPGLMAAMDALNLRFGRDAVRIGSTAVVSNGSETKAWSTKQDRRTPRFTTRWDEMLRVKA